MNTPNGNQHHQISIMNPSHSQPLQLPPTNLPCRDLLDRGEDFKETCIPLYYALTTNNFEVAKAILDKRPELVRFSITESYETILHIAVMGKSCLFVQYLMSLMTKEDLELPNGNGETTLCLVSRTGNVKIAKILMEKNERLIDIPNSQGKIPLQVAALCGKHDMVKYLYNSCQKMTGHFWTHKNRSWIFEKCVDDNLFDLALQMVIDYPKLAINGVVLRLLARNHHAFLPPKHHPVFFLMKLFFSVIFKLEDKETKALQLLRVILIDIMKLPKAEIDDLIRGPHEEDGKKKNSSQVLFLAAERGNTAFVVEVIRHYPHLALEVNDDNHSIFHVAVSHRHKHICRLLHEKDHIKGWIATLEDKNGNNILHLVGECAKGNILPNISGLGVRTDIEFQWFKALESELPNYLCKKKNGAGLTPYEVFIKNHKDPSSEEEKLMKETASQLMVVAAVVATISFATIFTFPGGYIQDTDTSILVQKTLSKIFIIFDSLSFLSSTTAILMVIVILLYDPNHRNYLMISSSSKIAGSMMLVFLATISIIITYLIGLFILYQSHSQWIPILITTFALMSYVMLVFTNRMGLFSFKSMSF